MTKSLDTLIYNITSLKTLTGPFVKGHECHDLAKQLSYYLYFFFFFSSRLITYKKCRKVSHHMTKSHEEHGKIVHRPYSSCISSIQEINKDSIEFFLSTWTWRVIKLSRLSHYSEDIKCLSWLGKTAKSIFIFLFFRLTI